MDNRNSGSLLGIGLAAGLALGLTIGLLYAPRPGRETRAMIKDRAMDIKDKAGDMAEDIRERAGSMMHSAKERLHVGGDSHLA